MAPKKTALRVRAFLTKTVPKKLRDLRHVDVTSKRFAVSLPWGSGVVEGNVNRLKMIKRQTYGRATFGLLRKRVLLTT